jgi:hypothetical protein
MVIYKNPTQKKLVVNARLEEVLWEENSVATATLLYADGGNMHRITARFINAPTPNLPQLYDRLSSVAIGSTMVVMLKQADNLLYAINFATDGEAFSLDGKTVFCGEAQVMDREVPEVGHVCGARIMATNGKYRIAAWNQHSSRILPANHHMIIIAHDGIIDNNTGDIKYLGDKAFPMEDFEMESTPSMDDIMETVINIGCYKRHPVVLKDIFQNREKQQVLSWMTFVADEWNPPQITPEQAKQKTAIAQFLGAITI